MKKRAGADISWIFDLEGEEGFRKREERILNELTQMQGIVLSTGGGAVLSKDSRNYLSARGIVIYLETTVENNFNVLSVTKNAAVARRRRSSSSIGRVGKNSYPLYEEVADITLPTDEQNAKVMVNQIVELIDNMNGLNGAL